MPRPEFNERLAEAQDTFVWETPAHDHHERGARWYWGLGLITLVLVLYAVWTANFLFAFLILLGAIILVLAGNHEPKSVLVQIGHNGVVWDGWFLPFDRVRHFAIVYQPPEVKLLYIQPKNYAQPRLRIELDTQDPLELRDHLKQYTHEDIDLQDEHASDMIARLLKL